MFLQVIPPRGDKCCFLPLVVTSLWHFLRTVSFSALWQR